VGVLSPEQAISLHGGAALFVVTVYTCAPLLVQMRDLGARVITFPEFAWANPEWLLPHAALDLPQSIFDDAEAVREAAEIWHDEASFQEYVGQLHWRTSLDEATLPSHLAPNETYFPLDLLTRSDDEVFVDCGAFDGDSIRTFIERWGGSFGRAIGIEADPVNCRRMQDYFASVPAPLRSRLTALNLAVGAAEGLVRFNTTGTAGSSIGAGEMEVRCEPLDKALGSEIPTFIKMDIEGAETEALLGARETLKRHAPVLAVCLYHRPSDLWRIPLLIRSIQPSYRLFLRRYADDCWEEVCYAIPESRLK
jgi:FkbM family methyltransferase